MRSIEGKQSIRKRIRDASAKHIKPTPSNNNHAYSSAIQSNYTLQIGTRASHKVCVYTLGMFTAKELLHAKVCSWGSVGVNGYEGIYTCRDRWLDR